jgi:osmoprotectant transport system ATP-binding protein
MINRLVEHDEGTLLFAGEEIRSLPVLELRRRMGYAIQSIGLFPHWTVAHNIATVLQLQKWSRTKIAARVDELMALLGLDESLRDRFPISFPADSSSVLAWPARWRLTRRCC